MPAATRILTEKSFVGAVRAQIKKSETCRIAVAYCGASASSFFPVHPIDWPLDLRVLIDAAAATVKRGFTNPHGVEKLLGITSEIRSLPGLHAKVLIFDEREAIVGSVNFS